MYAMKCDEQCGRYLQLLLKLTVGANGAGAMAAVARSKPPLFICLFAGKPPLGLRIAKTGPCEDSEVCVCSELDTRIIYKHS